MLAVFIISCTRGKNFTTARPKTLRGRWKMNHHTVPRFSRSATKQPKETANITNSTAEHQKKVPISSIKINSSLMPMSMYVNAYFKCSFVGNKDFANKFAPKFLAAIMCYYFCCDSMPNEPV